MFTLALTQHQALVEELYKEPIDGIFEDAMASILQEVDTIVQYLKVLH